MNKEIANIRCISRNKGPYQLDLLVGNHIVVLKRGGNAMEIFESIHDQVKENGQIGYDLLIKPYDYDNMIESKSFSIIEKDVCE